MTEKRNYREAIITIINRYERPGEDLERGIMEGAPSVISEREARGIARWLERNAAAIRGHDRRYRIIAEEIRRALIA